MYAVGRLGSYITQGVYTVSGPFHPFGGAVDIIVVEQQDGTFKSSPWYVRFGKFQGVLKSKEKIVDINVDGVQSDFHMYLDQRGQAYFLREVKCEEGDSLFYSLSSGEEADVAVPKDCSFDSPPSDSIDLTDGKMATRVGSRRSRILGLVFGNKSMKENGFREGEEESGVVRADSLERAEIAADLLEMKWSTNLAFSRYKKNVDTEINSDSEININNEKGEEVGIEPNATETKSRLRFQKMGSSDEDFGVEMSSLNDDLKEEICIDELVLTNGDDEKNVEIFSSEVKSVSETSLLVAEEPFDSSGKLVDNNYLNSNGNNKMTETCCEVMRVEPTIVSVNINDFENSRTRENFSPSQSSEEEILFFGEIDDLDNNSKDVSLESVSSTRIVEDNNPMAITKSNEEEEVCEKSRVFSSCIYIPKVDKFDGIQRMAESLPNMWPPMGDVVLGQLPLAHSLGSNFEASKEIVPVENLLSCIKLNDEKDDLVTQSRVEDSQTIEDCDNVAASIPVGDEFKAAKLSNGRWRVWPFSFRRSKSMNNNNMQIRTTKSFDDKIDLESTVCMEKEKDEFKLNAKKTKKVRVLTPTPEQLASLKLKEGENTVTFTFSTQMLGPQQVDARIFLWKWDTRIVISDVDGTITKSDVLGQFMPMVGMDWSHTGVAHLYSAIKENGYQLLFLSARAISQAYHTRRFLFNLKQDGKALPNGPVVISPDGLFPSLFREVIRRAPHEFKIACLEDIKALFPSDRSPFYAGFGNRDTDEISYLKVGIPKGKIFIINPKGEVVVNRRVDRKSYTSLKALVHDMFPPMSSSEQEDYNSWNFWKLPPPLIDF